MSGRLVILSKKKWNVWNQDNREKVLRDERLHVEAQEEVKDKEKQRLQEQNLETLLRESVSHGDDESYEVDTMESKIPEESKPFRLFEDLEAKAAKAITNEDYEKEKKHKELMAKKREGIADWAFGEGSLESSKAKPWYESLSLPTSFYVEDDADRSTSSKAGGVAVKIEPGLTLSKNLSINGKQFADKMEFSLAKDRENKRKDIGDPMHTILHKHNRAASKTTIKYELDNTKYDPDKAHTTSATRSEDSRNIHWPVKAFRQDKKEGIFAKEGSAVHDYTAITIKAENDAKMDYCCKNKRSSSSSSRSHSSSSSRDSDGNSSMKEHKREKAHDSSSRVVSARESKHRHKRSRSEENKEKEKEKDRDRDRDKDRNRDKDRHRNRLRDKDKDKHRHKHKDKNRDRAKEEDRYGSMAELVPVERTAENTTSQTLNSTKYTNNSSSRGSNELQKVLFSELRKRRLEREASEGKRAAILLAKNDIYGPNEGSSYSDGVRMDSANRYSQQYNPHIARPAR